MEVAKSVTSTDIKRQKLAMKIGTHSGSFHCDEALACYLLKRLPEYEDAEVIRSRNPDVLSKCDIVVDVGGVYDPASHRYDHHQRTFNESMNSLCPSKKWKTKLSSAGLVYFHFGDRILRRLIGDDVDEKVTLTLFDKIYDCFVEEVDAIDNGVNIADGDLRYKINTHISSRVGHLNPAWNDPEECDDEKLDKQFEKAVSLVGEEFMDRVKFYWKVWWPARSIVEDALKNRFQVDKSGEIIDLSPSSCPWKDHLLDLEAEQNIDPLIKFVVYADSSGSWRVQCVPVSKTSFGNRLSLLESWRGLRDSELCQVSGIEGCTFVHSAGFIGGNKTKEGALEMARRTLSSDK